MIQSCLLSFNFDLEIVYSVCGNLMYVKTFKFEFNCFLLFLFFFTCEITLLYSVVHKLEQGKVYSSLSHILGMLDCGRGRSLPNRFVLVSLLYEIIYSYLRPTAKCLLSRSSTAYRRENIDQDSRKSRNLQWRPRGSRECPQRLSSRAVAKELRP